MKNRLLLGWVLGILPFLASAQSDSRIAPTQTPLSQVERLVMPPLNNKALYEAELERRGPGVAPRFAEAIEVDIRPEERGAWEILPDDRAVWRLRIHSAGAKSLNEAIQIQADFVRDNFRANVDRVKGAAEQARGRGIDYGGPGRALAVLVGEQAPSHSIEV